MLTYETQFLTGHSCFGTYLNKIKKKEDICLYCTEIDSPEHTFFHCCQWQDKKEQLVNKIGEISQRNFIGKTKENESNCTAALQYIIEIM